MPTSGVEVPEEIKVIIRDIVSQEKTMNYLSAVFELEDIDGGKAHQWVVRNTSLKFPEILKHKQVSKEEFLPHYEAFYNDLKVREMPVFALFDLAGCKDSKFKKTIAVQWCPDNSPIKKKMLFASSVASLISLSSDSTRVIKTNDAEDILFDEISKA